MRKQLIYLVMGITFLGVFSSNLYAHQFSGEISFRNPTNWKNEKLKISTNGDIEFNDSYTDIVSISEDGYLKISMVSFGMKRKLYVSSCEGKVDYRYFEGNKEVSFEPKGREWMQKVLPDVIRNTGLDLENRVNKIYKKDGISGFLSELGETNSDYYRSRMVKYLLKNNKLSKGELKELVREFPYRIHSDYELSQIYKKYNPVFLYDAEVAEEFFNSLEEVSSDYELSQILTSVYKLNELTNENFILFIDALDDISSDYEKTNIVKLAIKNDKLTEKQLHVLLEKVKEISSDYNKSQIIKHLLENNGLSSNNIDEIMKLTQTVSSDYEVGQIINSIIGDSLLSLENLDEFTNLLEQLSSDYTYKGILNELIKYDKLGPERFDFLLESSDHISSNYELSGFYNSLLNHGKLTREQQLKLIAKATNISSNYELAKFLINAAEKMDLDDKKIHDALVEATQNIGSEYEYGKVMKAIYSRRSN